jgi:hypothetical protein
MESRLQPALKKGPPEEGTVVEMLPKPSEFEIFLIARNVLLIGI